MKRLIPFVLLLALILFAGAVTASPTDSDIAAYKAREQIYVAMGQSPEQIIISLDNYFGKHSFYTRSNGWNNTVDITYTEGVLDEITFFEVLDTVSVK